MDWRRMAIIIAINVVVSAAVTLIILSMWESRRSSVAATPASIVVVATQAARPTAATEVPGPQPPATPTITPTPAGPFQYVIQSGDTLGSLSLEFGVPLEDLLTANDLTEDAVLSVGQEITIPVGGLTTPTPTPTPEAATVEASGPPNVIIFEIASPGTLSAEAVVLVNLGERISLAAWTLSDGKNSRYAFPDVTLFPDARISLHTGAGTNSPSDLYWGQSEAIWGETGTVAYLRDAKGRLIASWRVP